MITWCHVEWYVYVFLFSIKCFRGSCGLRKVWYDIDVCLVANLDGQLFVTRVTRRVLLMEHELLALPKHPRWPPVFSGVRVARSIAFNVLFYRLLIVILSFYFCHYIVSIFKIVFCVVLDDSFFHSPFLLYHYQCTPSFIPSATIYPYILLFVCLFSSWL